MLGVVAACAAIGAIAIARGGPGPAEPPIDCATQSLDSGQWRHDQRTLSGMVEHVGDLTRSQYAARIIKACVKLEGGTRRDVSELLGRPHAGGHHDDWVYALGELRGVKGSEDLEVRFGDDDRVSEIVIVRGTHTSLD